jgi:hypothetical protein
MERVLLEDETMRWALIVAFVLGSVQAKAQVWEQNIKCETACRATLDQCSAVPNRVMDTALNEMTPYTYDSPDRDKPDIKFENAFEAGEKCRGRYLRCAGKCQPPKKCVDACQATFKRCFAIGERKMKEGLRELKTFKYDSPQWKTAYGKGDAEMARCLEDNRNCRGKCANP